MMHDPGKSDGPIVPEKRPNKAGQPAAEAVEGRGPAERNPNRQNTPRTQSRTGVPSALERVRQVARRDTRRRCDLTPELEARSGCAICARPDPCVGPPARAAPTAARFPAGNR